MSQQFIKDQAAAAVKHLRAIADQLEKNPTDLVSASAHSNDGMQPEIHQFMVSYKAPA